MFNKRGSKSKMPSGMHGRASAEITVMGWVRTFRNNQFIALNDGSSNENLQMVLTLGLFEENLLKKITTGASIKAAGKLVASPGKGQTGRIKSQTCRDTGFE